MQPRSTIVFGKRETEALVSGIRTFFLPLDTAEIPEQYLRWPYEARLAYSIFDERNYVHFSRSGQKNWEFQMPITLSQYTIVGVREPWCDVWDDLGRRVGYDYVVAGESRENRGIWKSREHQEPGKSRTGSTMMKEQCRYFIEITEVELKFFRDLTPQDCEQAGYAQKDDLEQEWAAYYKYKHPLFVPERNPLVLVYSFSLTEKPVDWGLKTWH